MGCHAKILDALGDGIVAYIMLVGMTEHRSHRIGVNGAL